MRDDLFCTLCTAQHDLFHALHKMTWFMPCVRWLVLCSFMCYMSWLVSYTMWDGLFCVLPVMVSFVYYIRWLLLLSTSDGLFHLLHDMNCFIYYARWLVSYTMQYDLFCTLYKITGVKQVMSHGAWNMKSQVACVKVILHSAQNKPSHIVCKTSYLI